MHKDRRVFAQLVQFMDRNHFNYLLRKYDGDRYVKSYTCWNQLLTLMFGQLSNRESLRDLIVAMEAHARKLYHPGIGKSVTRSNLSKANEQRDYRIFEELAFYMIAEARKLRIRKIFDLEVMYMLSILPPLTSACRFPSGLSFVSTGWNQDAYALRCGGSSPCICAYYRGKSP